MAGALSGSDNEAVREAALGFALSPDPAVSSAALVAITQQGRAGWCRIGSWIGWCACALGFRRGAGERSTRHPCVASENGIPVPLTRWEIRSVLASLCDGAGAQSLFALTKQGRRFALASVLVKTEVGVADAWVREGMTKAEADALIAQIVAGAEAVEHRSPSSSGGSPMPLRSMLHATSPRHSGCSRSLKR